ncbi:uncharacterized protein unm_hu7910 isoform X22 [Mustelus asterias]
MTSKNKAGNSRFNSSGPRKDKHSSSKNGKKSDGPSGSSFFTWFMIIALLGVWSSVAVVWFDLVDYKDVLAKAKEFRYNFSEVLQGKLGAYDADGDGDFDVEDAKILLGLTKGDGSNEQIDTLEEVLDIITEESSDWVYGFLSFLYDVMTPFEILEEEENEASEDVAEPGGKLKAKEKAKEKVKEALRELKKAKEKTETMKKAKRLKPIRVAEEEKPKKAKKEKAELKVVKLKKEKPVSKPEMRKMGSEKEKKDQIGKVKAKEKPDSLKEKMRKLFEKLKGTKNVPVKNKKEAPKSLEVKTINKEKEKKGNKK